MAQIELKNLTYTYSNGFSSAKNAVDNVSLTIAKGEFIGLIGHTGSGKSTLVKQLNGLLRPTFGHVFLDGQDIWNEPKRIREVRFKVGMVFQYPEHQLFEDTVYRDIAFGPANMGLSANEVEQKVHDACKFVELSLDVLNKSPFDLSGGEKRKAAIAGVVAMEPEVLVLDEPTAGLDPLTKEQILQKLFEYNKQRGKTVILISHNMEDIARYADKVAVLEAGKLVMFNLTRNVFSCEKELRKIGLAAPQITSIMSRLKLEFPQLKDGILTVEEGVTAIRNFIKNGSAPTKYQAASSPGAPRGAEGPVGAFGQSEAPQS